MKEILGTWLLFLVPLLILISILWVIMYFTQNFEGVASIGLLILGFGTIVWLGHEIVENKFTILIFIVVFSILGIIFDGAGNFIYNKPIQMLCPAETVLSREVIVSEDYEGNTAYRHVFSCYSMTQGQSVKQLPLYQTGGIRLVQYLTIGFVLLGFYWLIIRLFRAKK